jgi:Caspase domain
MPLHDPWKEHLESQLDEDIQGLKVLEDARRTEADPRRKLSLNKDIGELEKRIQERRIQLQSASISREGNYGEDSQNATINQRDVEPSTVPKFLESHQVSNLQPTDFSGKASQKTKIALLIGVSEYMTGFAPIPGAKVDVAAMQEVLQSPDLGSFDEVLPLINPDAQEMRQAIENLFASRKKDDLLVLFFSGHGIKDNSGKLYFGTRTTCKNSNGELVKSSAVSANFIHDIMDDCRSRQQVVILDCCFSGAFAAGLLAKDDEAIDVKAQLGGEGRVILASSTSTQPSFARQNAEPSIYTRYLVEGIQTGEADLDQDSFISISELHHYVRDKVRDILPSLNPKMYAEREGYKIQLAKSPISRNILPLSTSSSQHEIVTQQDRSFKINLIDILLWGSVISIVVVVLGYVLIRMKCNDINNQYESGEVWIFYKYRDKNHPQRQICEMVDADLKRW